MSNVLLELPYHLRTLAGLTEPLTLTVNGPVSMQAVLDELEARHPMLRGTIRDHVTGCRRPYLRFFAGGQDISHQAPTAALPSCVTEDEQPLTILGAISGG